MKNTKQIEKDKSINYRQFIIDNLEIDMKNLKEKY